MLSSSTLRTSARSVSRSSYSILRNFASQARPNNFINIVEVGPRDGLQNENKLVDVAVKVELIDRLGQAGLKAIEAGAFVSPKWVPQMGTTKEVLQQMNRRPGVSYPLLVPNTKGLEALLVLRETDEATTPRKLPLNQIAIFTAASDSFSKANTNNTVKESIKSLREVAREARDAGCKVRGYVSTVISCPFEGPIAPSRVADVAKELFEMGCYEVSLGDTIGTGTKLTVVALLNEMARQGLPLDKMAAHYHDTYGMAVANVLVSIECGIRTVDSSVAGLGGCPYSPGATGNAATEDIVHALHGAGYDTGVDLKQLVGTGQWISGVLGRTNESRAGRGWSAYWERQEMLAKKKAGL